MNDLGLHNSGFRKRKEMNEVWLRLERSREGGRVPAHLFKERNSVKEMEEAFCPASFEIYKADCALQRSSLPASQNSPFNGLFLSI